MKYGPTPFPRQPLRAIVIRPDCNIGTGFEVGAMQRPRSNIPPHWLRDHGPFHCGDLELAWTIADNLRRTSGLPILDHSAPAPAAPTGGVAA